MKFMNKDEKVKEYLENGNYESTVDPVTVGKFIKKARIAHNLTQDELGKKIFISRKAISKWENGDGLPSIDLLRPLSDALNVSLEELLKGDFVEEEVETDSGTSEKIWSSAKFKIIVVVFIILALFVFSASFMLLRLSKREYVINYEDKNFVIENGVISFSNNKCYISLGNFDSNLLENHKFHYKLHILENINDVSNDLLLLDFSSTSKTYLEPESCVILETHLQEDYIDKLFLDVAYLGKDGIDTVFRLKMKDAISKESDKKGILFEDLLFKAKEGNRNTANATASDSDFAVDAISVEFLFKLTPADLEDMFDGIEIVVDGIKYKVEYDIDIHTLKLTSSNNYFISLNFETNSLVYKNENWNDFIINKNFHVEFNASTGIYYSFIKSIFEALNKA